jgi:hypothetical protein
MLRPLRQRRLSEHGEALTVLDPRMAEISPTRVVANAGLKAKMRAHGMRPLMRRTGLSQHTLKKILAGQAVRPATLERVIAAIGR